jgi:putative membrane protein
MTLLLIGSACVAQAESPKPASDAAPMLIVETPAFVKTVMSSSRFEIQSSRLAQEKAANGDVKEFAAMLIADHAKAENKLKALLQPSGDFPTDTPLAPKHQKMLQQLEAATGQDFEVLYIDMQAQAHMEAVSLFRTYAGSGDKQSIVGFAKETLPRLEMHLGHVKHLVMLH